MAETKGPRGPQPLPGKPEPRLPHSPANPPDAAQDLGSAPAGLGEAPARRKRQSWFQRNRNLATGLMVGGSALVLLVLVGWLFGWFGGGRARSPVAAVPRGTPPQPPAGSTPPPPPAVTPPPPAPAAKPEPPKDKPRQQQQEPPLTDDFAKWKGPDWSRARRENHPKLREAVVCLGGESSSGSALVAKRLTDLLKPLKPEKPAETPATPPPGTPGGPGPQPGVPAPPPGTPGPAPSTPAPPPGKFGFVPGVPSPPPGAPSLPPSTPSAAPNSPNSRPYTAADLAALVDAIITALGNNGSDVARTTINEVLAGAFATDDDKVAVESAVKALVAHSSEDNDALLVRLLITPETVRSTDRQGPWPARELQVKTFELIKQSPSCGLRTRMAEAVIEHRETLNAEDSMHKFLLEDNPLNCGAQAVFYQKQKAIGIKPEIKTKLEEQLLKYSSLALGRYLGIPDQFQAGTGGPGMPASPATKPIDRFAPPSLSPLSPEVAPSGGPPAKPAEVNLAAELAGQLWTKEFRAALEPELGKFSLEKQSQLLLLAATIPQDSTRALLAKTLKKRVNAKTSDEPTPLETAGLIDKVVTDPGLLVPIKMLPWKDLRPPRPGTTVDKSKLSDTVKKEQETKEKWMELSRKMVEAWCKRFYAAAQAKEETQGAAAAPKLPAGWKLDPNATVKAAYHLAWPDEAPPEIAKLNPGLLNVYYVRIEENNKPRKVIDYYCGQARAKQQSEVRTIDKNTWIYNVRVAPDRKDCRRSVDVWITNPQAVPVAPKPTDRSKPDRTKTDAQADLVIELLIIEIKEPAKD